MCSDNMILEIIDILVIKTINGRVWLEQGMTSTDCKRIPTLYKHTKGKEELHP